MDSNEHEQTEICEAHDDLLLVPFVGKEFVSLEDAKQFYNNYAFRMGFSIREGPFYKSVKSEDVTARRYLCSMAGLSTKNREAKSSKEGSSSQRTPQKDI